MRELRLRPRWIIASALVVALIFVLSAAGGLAFQASSSRTTAFGQPRDSGAGRQPVCNQNNATDPLTAIAAALNLSQAQLQRDLDSGSSLTQVIAEQGLTEAQVRQAAVEWVKTTLAQEQSGGRISSAQEETTLASTLTGIEEAFNGETPTANGGRQRGLGQGVPSFNPCGG